MLPTSITFTALEYEELVVEIKVTVRSSVDRVPENPVTVSTNVDFNTGEALFGVIAEIIAGAVDIVKEWLVSAYSLILMVIVTDELDERNLPVSQFMEVEEVEVTEHAVASVKVIDTELPSSDLGGKFDPVIVIWLPP